MKVQKTKTGCMIMVIAAIVCRFADVESGLSIFMIGVAIAFYGVYDKSNRLSVESHVRLDDLRKKIKKPMLRSNL